MIPQLFSRTSKEKNTGSVTVVFEYFFRIYGKFSPELFEATEN